MTLCPKGASASTSNEIVTLRNARAWCDRRTLDRILSYRRHYETDDRPPRPYWRAEDFAELVGLAAIEANRKGVRP